MRFGYSEVCLAHDTGTRHPESPDRLRAIRRGLQGAHAVEYVDAPAAEVDALTAVHDAEYVEEVRDFCADGGGAWDADTIAVEATWDAIRQSAGHAVWAAERALAGDDGRSTPFAIGRPPGHHAVVDDAMGFCFVNNVAVAAQAALDADDLECDAVAVVDWDVHHGNGTQDLFYERDDVFVASLHEQGIYPGSGAREEVGAGDGLGWTLNVPLPPESGDATYEVAIDQLVRPAVLEADPDLVLVSAGFDAHEEDPISTMEVSTEAYGRFAEQVRDLAADADAGLAFVLEGGYGLEELADSVRKVHEVFDGYVPETPGTDVGDEARSRVGAVADVHPLLDGCGPEPGESGDEPPESDVDGDDELESDEDGDEPPEPDEE